jgi:hypothetical protein
VCACTFTCGLRTRLCPPAGAEDAEDAEDTEAVELGLAELETPSRLETTQWGCARFLSWLNDKKSPRPLRPLRSLLPASLEQPSVSIRMRWAACRLPAHDVLGSTYPTKRARRSWVGTTVTMSG